MKKRIVYTSGTFDLFHVGHLNILKKAKEQGDFLIVGVSTDELVASYKKGKPVIPLNERKALIEACQFVDRVVTQETLVSTSEIKTIDPDVYVIGDDWKEKHLEGVEWMKKQTDKEVVYVPYTKHISSTKIKEKIHKSNK